MNTVSLPGYAYIPDGPFPRPAESAHPTEPLREEDWFRSATYLHAFALFNAGYYWEAHEVWESLWHAAGRVGPIADLLRGLIKLAAAGVKVRQNQRHGIVTHATRAAVCFDSARTLSASPRLLGMDLDELAETARFLADSPPEIGWDLWQPLVQVFEFRLLPKAETADES